MADFFKDKLSALTRKLNIEPAPKTVFDLPDDYVPPPTKPDMSYSSPVWSDPAKRRAYQESNKEDIKKVFNGK